MSSAQAREFLERLQLATYRQWQIRPPAGNGEFGLDFYQKLVASRYPDLSDEETEQRIAEAREELKLNLDDIPTPYEEPRRYNIMRGLAEKIEQAAADLKIEIPRRPVLGTLPTGQINAMTIRVPGTDDFLIIFEWQLFLFALLLSKAVCRALPVVRRDKELHYSLDPGEIRQRIDSDPTVVGRFAEVVIAYAVTGEPGKAPQYFAEPQYPSLIDHLLNSVELFVMGHEYGHMILGHLSDTPTRELPQIDGAGDISYSWMQEHEADFIGTYLMLQALSGSLDAALSYWGADFFFSAMDIMDRAVSLLSGRENADRRLSSHPPTDRRRALLREQLPQMMNDSNAASALQMSDGIHDVTELLWSRVAPQITELHDRGVRPAPWWEST